MTLKTVKPPIKLEKSKFLLRHWILSYFPNDIKNYIYVEPFGGEANILFNKEQSETEVYNDRDERILNIFKSIRDEPSHFQELMNFAEIHEEEFVKKTTVKDKISTLEYAVLEIISRKDKKCKRTKLETKRIHSRIKEVYMFNDSALSIIKTFNSPKVFFYIDPPYFIEKKRENEMGSYEHEELSNILHKSTAKVIISGCSSLLYDNLYKDWNKHINSEKNEVIWKNF